ncbi:Dps family protein [soil metagenome]
MQPNTGITTSHLDKIAHALCCALADEFVLYAKTRNAHWNVEGSDFYDKHKFFESQYEQLDETMDMVAERIRTICHYAPARLYELLRLTRLSEQPVENNDSLTFIKTLLEDHESIIIHLRENINLFTNELNDAGTSDFITSLMETHEKMAWMLRAHLR